MAGSRGRGAERVPGKSRESQANVPYRGVRKPQTGRKEKQNRTVEDFFLSSSGRGRVVFWIGLATVNFDGDVDQLLVLFQRGFVFLGRFGVMGNEGNDGGEFVGADLPDVQIGDEGVAVRFDGLADFPAQIAIVRHLVQEDGLGLADQAIGPLADDAGTHNAHDRVKPRRTPELAGCQSNDGEHGSGRIGQHVDVGGLQIDVVRVGMGMSGDLA